MHAQALHMCSVLTRDILAGKEQAHNAAADGLTTVGSCIVGPDSHGLGRGLAMRFGVRRHCRLCRLRSRLRRAGRAPWSFIRRLGKEMLT